jgi:hypothetical protein
MRLGAPTTPARRKGSMEPLPSPSSDDRDPIPGWATIATLLLVGGSAKLGYGLWALGVAVLLGIGYAMHRYVIAGVTALPSQPVRRL